MGAKQRAASPRAGYTLVAIMVGITIMMVMIAAVLPLASTEMKRAREDELIFRGRQYAEGVRVFRRRYGRFPNTLREMYEVRPRTLRKLWKDPMTDSETWGVIGLVTGAPLPGSGAPPGGGLGPAGGAGGGKGGSTFGGTGGFGSTGTFGGTGGFGSGGKQPAPQPTKPADSGALDPFGGPGQHKGDSPTDPLTGLPAGPVTGVYSLSHKKALRLFQGREIYSDWRFTEDTLSGGGLVPGSPGAATIPGTKGGPAAPPGGPVGGPVQQ